MAGEAAGGGGGGGREGIHVSDRKDTETTLMTEMSNILHESHFDETPWKVLSLQTYSLSISFFRPYPPPEGTELRRFLFEVQHSARILAR